MRIAVYSDVHANLPAYEAVLADIKTQSIDSCFNLGDVVGYGPFPEETIALAKSTGHTTLLGNHDAAVVDHRKYMNGSMQLKDTEAVRWGFHSIPLTSIRWTERQLNQPSIEFLSGLPLVAHRTTKPLRIKLYHAAPYSYNHHAKKRRLVTNWSYVLFNVDVAVSLDSIPNEAIAFYGHSHMPGVYTEEDSKKEFVSSRDFRQLLPLDNKVLVNVGSVGQPRDCNPDACYCIFDTRTEELTFRSVPYDVERTRKALHAIADQLHVGWPEALAARLKIGE